MMKSSQFIPKMEPSRSQNKGFFDFSNLDDESEEEYDDDHSYSFHPVGTSQSDASALRNCSSTSRIDSVKVTREKAGMALISEIDQMMKYHFDNLLHAVDGLSARLSQLETKTRQLENAVDDLKNSTEYNHGKTDGKLRQLENMLREVQDDIHFLRDKQDIAETQLQLAKLQGSKGPQSEDQKSAVRTESMQQTSSSTFQQSDRPLPILGALSLAHATLSPNIPLTLPYQNPPPAAGVPVAAQHPTEIHHNPIPSAPLAESYHVPSGGQTFETTHQQYHGPPTQQGQPPPPAADRLYQPATQVPQVLQSPQGPQQSQLHAPVDAVNPQNHPPLSHHREGAPYMSSHSYPSSILQSSSQPPVVAPTQQFYVDSTHQMHSQQTQHLSRPNSNFLTGYSQAPGPANFSKVHPYGGSPYHYSNSMMKSSQLSPSSSVSSSGNDYTRLPKAQILPHALPMASSIDAGSGSVESGKKVPIDDVVDKVTGMGFRRDLVRTTVKKLTENGQTVDLNVVLDKLMTDGNIRPQKG